MNLDFKIKNVSSNNNYNYSLLLNAKRILNTNISVTGDA